MTAPKPRYIIDGRQRPLSRVLDWVATMAGWLLVLTLIWQLDRAAALIVTSLRLGLALFGLLLLWTAYNRWRYGRPGRRRPPRPVTPAELAAYFGLETPRVITMQEQSWLALPHLLEIDNRGVPRRLRVLQPRPDEKGAIPVLRRRVIFVGVAVLLCILVGLVLNFSWLARW